MSTPFEEPTRNAQEEEQAGSQTRIRSRRSSRRKMLAKGLGVAAVASAGAGALLELSSGTASADSIKPGVFASSKAGTPAVKASATNGADGVDASSDSGTGVSASSGSGTALVATSSSGLAAHFVGGNVTMDNNLNVTGALSTGTLSSGAGVLASGVSGTPAVKATGTSGADGMDAASDSGTGVLAQTGTGIGLHAVRGGPPSPFAQAAVFAEGNGQFAVWATSTGVAIFGDGLGAGSIGVEARGDTGIRGVSIGGGNAGLFQGNVQVVGSSTVEVDLMVGGNLTVSGTKSFVQAHPTDSSQEIVYVALEGGEAGTYVRGSGQLHSGKAVLALPEHFGLVTATEGLTVQLTPRGEWLQLYVVELDTTQLVVREAQGKSGQFDYFICGVRSGYEQHEVIRTKR